MSATRLVSLFGASIIRRSHTAIPFPSPNPSIRLTELFFPSSSLRLRRRLCSSSAAVVDADTFADVSTDHSLHPWPEWVAFVDGLKTKGYLVEHPPRTAALPESEDSERGSIDGSVYKDLNLLKQACLSFARDRFDIFKSLSRQDIQTIVEKGCPNLFRKVVNSAKRLRVYVQLDEGDVCSACNLRGSCDRAYVIQNEEEGGARTVDIVRILMMYALDPLVSSSGGKPPGRELVDVSARKLLSELMELSEAAPDPELPKPATKVTNQIKQSRDFEGNKLSQDVEMKRGDWMCPNCNFVNFAKNLQCLKCGEDGPRKVGRNDAEMKKGDWVCPECNFMNFARNIRCLKCKTEGPKRVDFNDIEMKKGDWNCPQCGFMNFASNTKCLRCRDARPLRQQYPGEWECPSCDFLNYSRNAVCKRCNCERPKGAGTTHEE